MQTPICHTSRERESLCDLNKAPFLSSEEAAPHLFGTKFAKKGKEIVDQVMHDTLPVPWSLPRLGYRLCMLSGALPSPKGGLQGLDRTDSISPEIGISGTDAETGGWRLQSMRPSDPPWLANPPD